MSGRHRPTRSRRADLSQHFLRESSARRLVQATSISKSDLIVEIGAGLGALTKPLVKRAGKVVAVEIDTFLARKLRNTLGSNAEVVATDFLTLELPSASYSIIGNLPYAQTTEIVRRISEVSNPPRDAWLVVQREFALRIIGHPFARESLWSLRLKPFWHFEIVDRLKRAEFDPPPSVDSVFLQMSFRERSIIDVQDTQAYVSMVEHAFRGHSTVLDALRASLTKVQIRRLASDLRFNVDDRCSDLFFEQWLGIFRFVRRRLE